MAITPRRIDTGYQDTVYNFIKREEALVRRVYSDQLGIPTLGVGYALIIRAPAGSPTPFILRPTLQADLAAIGETLGPADESLLNTLLNNLNSGNGADNIGLVPMATQFVNYEEPASTSATLNVFEDIGVLSDAQSRQLFDISIDRARTQLRNQFGVRAVSWSR
jgi:hypothetical protein